MKNLLIPVKTDCLLRSSTNDYAKEKNSTTLKVEFDDDTGFRMNLYYVIIDQFNQIRKRKCTYDDPIYYLKNLNKVTMRENDAELCKTYVDDLENKFILRMASF